MDANALFGYLLMWTIPAAAILTALWFAWHQVFLFTGAFVLLLLAYVYLAWYGDEPIEERLI